MEEEMFFAALNRLTRLTPTRFMRLLTHFENDPARMWRAERGEWIRAGIDDRTIDELMSERTRIDPAREWEKLQKLDVTVVPITSAAYPALLRESYGAPPVLLARGAFPLPADACALAVVGSRVTTSYGRQVTTTLTRELVARGIAIVSGLATGVDALAHQTTVEAGGRTIAVLGSGVDIIYPPANRGLAERIIAEGGAIISEYPLGTEPTAYNFPQRNRIIAGLTRGTLVTEAREKSGSLITAQLANDGGREVFAVPGSIFSENSGGTNALIKAGARPVTAAADIIEILGWGDTAATVAVHAAVGDTPAEAQLLTALTREAQHADELTRMAGLSTGEVSATLSLLEMKGFAKNLGGNQWVRN